MEGEGGKWVDVAVKELLLPTPTPEGSEGHEEEKDEGGTTGDCSDFETKAKCIKLVQGSCAR